MKSKKGTGPIKDMTGQTFGRWFVIRYAIEHPGKKAYWLCRCRCGVEKEIVGDSLRSGKSTSCGCYKIENLIKEKGRNAHSDGESAFNALYYAYKTRSKVKNQEFSLSKPEFAALTKDICKYCGAIPSQIFNNGKRLSSYIYNGIDRVDSSKGYTTDNSVSCCKTCNLAKNDLTLDEFLIWINRLIKFQTMKETVESVERNLCLPM